MLKDKRHKGKSDQENRLSTSQQSVLLFQN